MKKMLASLMFALLACTILGGLVFAGEVYDRKQLTLSSSGSYTWTNDIPYAAIQLKRIEVVGMNHPTDTVTVQRVTGDTVATTNTILALVASSSAATSNLVSSAGSGPEYLKFGDKLKATSGWGSNGYVNVEYIVEKH